MAKRLNLIAGLLLILKYLYKLQAGLNNMQRTYDTSFRTDNLIIPPDMSPICDESNNISCNSLRSRKSATRLDFSTHMSVDNSNLEDKENDKSQLINNQSKFIQLLLRL